MFGYGVLGGVAVVVLLVFSVKLVVRACRYYWSLDRHWKKYTSYGLAGAVRGNKLFMRLLVAPGVAAARQLSTATNNHIRELTHGASFMCKIFPPALITAADLDRQVDTSKPAKVIDIVGTGGPRRRVLFDRILTPKLKVDVDELRMWPDARQFLASSGAGLANELDSKFIDTVNKLLVGANKAVPETGKVQWLTLDGGINRDTVALALSGLELPLSAVLVNDHFVDAMTFKRDVDEEARSAGEYDDEGVRWIVTKKYDIVPDGAMFLFAAPEELGRHLMLEDATAYFDRRAYELEYFGYMSPGFVLTNACAVARVDFKVEEEVKAAA